MDEELAAILAELERFGSEHDGALEDRLQRLRNLEPDSARLLALLVRATGARALLEIGTSNGYSTLWLADGARSVGGHLVSVELDAPRMRMAAANIERAGLRELVELRLEDAAETLTGAAEASFDMVFLDAERTAYVDYWPALVRVLRPGGLLVVDNVISHAGELQEFRAIVSSDARVSEALVPIGAGLLLIVREPRASGEPPARAAP